MRLEPAPERKVLTRSQQADYEKQWQALAEGSYRPVDEETGMELAALEPVLRLGHGAALEEEAAGMAASLERLVGERVKAALRQAVREQEEAERRLKDYSNRENQTLEAVAPVLVDSHRYEEAPLARPDPRAGGVKAPSLRRGWVAEQWEGEPPGGFEGVDLRGGAGPADRGLCGDSGDGQRRRRRGSRNCYGWERREQPVR